MSQSLRGHLRELVSELWKETVLDEIDESLHATRSDSNPVVTLVTVQRSIDVPLSPQHFESSNLTFEREIVECSDTPRSEIYIRHP